jgi:hypothetical protein
MEILSNPLDIEFVLSFILGVATAILFTISFVEMICQFQELAQEED